MERFMTSFLLKYLFIWQGNIYLFLPKFKQNIVALPNSWENEEMASFELKSLCFTFILIMASCSNS